MIDVHPQLQTILLAIALSLGSAAGHTDDGNNTGGTAVDHIIRIIERGVVGLIPH